MVRKANKSAIGLLGIGTLIEWAEFTVYGYLALTLAQVFFPNNHHFIAIIKTFSVFAVGYFMRPLGALLFGYIGDTYGRKPALMGALTLMGFATTGIGLLPTYEQIGIIAPLFLCLFRLLQGIAVSGEFNGAAIFLIEQHKNYRPAFMGACISANAGLGMVIGGLGALWALQPHAPDWAWRVPFLIGGISAIIGLFVRRGLTESCEYKKDKVQHKLSFAGLFTHFKPSFVFVGLTGAFAGILVYINNIYIVVYLSQHAQLSKSSAMSYAILGESLSVLLILACGWLADKLSTRLIFYTGLILTTLLSPVIYLLLDTPQSFNITLAMMIFALLNGLTSGPMMKCLYDQFPTIGRYTGVSFSWSVFVALFAGTAPIVAHTMVHYQLNPGWYVSLFALICVIILPRVDVRAKPLPLPI